MSTRPALRNAATTARPDSLAPVPQRYDRPVPGAIFGRFMTRFAFFGLYMYVCLLSRTALPCPSGAWDMGWLSPQHVPLPVPKRR